MSADQPNIILFTTDQHRGDHIGLAGHPVVQTPDPTPCVTDPPDGSE